MKKAWPEMEISARRETLGSAFDAIIVERGKREELGQRVHFIAAGEMPGYFPTQGNPAPVRQWTPPA